MRFREHLIISFANNICIKRHIAPFIQRFLYNLRSAQSVFFYKVFLLYSHDITSILLCAKYRKIVVKNNRKSVKFLEFACIYY